MSVVLLFGSVLSLNATALHSQSAVSLRMRNVGITELIKEVERQSEQTVIYNNTVLRDLGRVSVEATDASGSDVLNRALSGTGLVCTVVDDFLVIQRRGGEPRQQSPVELIEGRVVDRERRPVAGATVRLRGSVTGVSSDQNGYFRLRAPQQGERTIVVSYIGMKTREMHVIPGRELVVEMEEDQIDIDQVIVTGIIDKPRESYTGAVTTVTKEMLRQEFSSNILRTLSNLEPSLRIAENNSQGSNPNVPIEINLRGRSTLLDIGALDYANAAGSGRDADPLRMESYYSLNSPIYILDGFEITQQRMLDLNIEEIESVNILKDAAATSLYGSRGANGVIVMTSVHPQQGRLRVSYRGSLKLEIPDLSTYDRLSALEKLELEKDYGLWANSMELYDSHVADIENGRVFDWIDAPLRTGVGQNHSLSMDGGTDQWRFRADVSSQNTRGAMKGSDRNNFNGSLNVYYTTQRVRVSQLLTVGVNTNADSPYGNFGSYYSINPYYYPWDEAGLPVLEFDQISRPDYRLPNPMYDALKNNSRRGEYTSIRSATNVHVNITEGLYAVANIGLNRQISSRTTLYVPSDTRFSATGGRMQQRDSKDDGWETGLGLNYYRTLGEKHTIAANLNAQMAENVSSSADWMAEGFVNDNLMSPGMAQRYPTAAGPEGSTLTTHRLSFIGSANYYYDKRYFVDATLSRDGTSSFGRFSRYGTFWSVGAGWMVSGERFMKENLSRINELKLRYSYGVSGNMGFDPQAAMATYGLNITDYYTPGQAGYYLLGIENPHLEWQGTFQHSVGADLGLFANRLRFSFGYYNKLTENAVNVVNVSISHGFPDMSANIGTIRNEGWEYNVSGVVVQRREGLNLGLSVRMATNRNTIVKVSDAFKEQLKSTFSLNNSVEMLRYREGHSMDAIYGLRTVGVDPATGERWYVKEDGTLTQQAKPEMLVYLGEKQPRMNGTLNLWAQYKGLRITTGIQFRWGGMSENGTELGVENASLSGNLDRRVLSDVWRKPGDRALYKNMLTSATYANNMFVHRDDMISAGNINVEYSLPEAWVRKLGMEHLSVGMDYSDAFYFSTIRRERGTYYPFSRNPNFLIRCTF